MNSNYREILRRREVARQLESQRTTPRGAELAARAGRLSRLEKERVRLVQTLVYYEWLSARDIDYAQVRGVRRESSPLAGPRARSVLYNLRMQDGSERIIEDPPFDEAVIFNRSYLTEEPQQHDQTQEPASSGDPAADAGSAD